MKIILSSESKKWLWSLRNGGFELARCELYDNFDGEFHFVTSVISQSLRAMQSLRLGSSARATYINVAIFMSS